MSNLSALVQQAMKPRLKFRAGIWSCSGHGSELGFGFTPREAFEHWQRKRASIWPQSHQLLWKPLEDYTQHAPFGPTITSDRFVIGDVPGWWRNGTTCSAH